MDELCTKNITQGEFAVGSSEDLVITTILGSCVSACLWDPVAHVGGMNHILLPDLPDSIGCLGSGVNAMELLINAIIKNGGMKSRLKAKIFGGSKMVSRLSDVGQRNAEFVLNFLVDERIDCLAHSLGGEQARRIQFWPFSGRARQKLLGRIDLPEKILPPSLESVKMDAEIF
ncbi:MAG TPA: chemotaxis protein CheD [Rhodobacteraceae bacterium]|nr:chemotaxis protein CheD [Paracoccaceae bacterium]